MQRHGGDVLEAPVAGPGAIPRLREALELPPVFLAEAPPLQPQLDEAPAPARLRVHIVDAALFLGLREAWTDLTRRAAEPNPFLDPAIVAAAAEGAGATQGPVLLVWQRERLVGVWAFRRSRPRSGLRLDTLSTPIHPTAPDATPVIDAELIEPVLAAMLTAIEAAPALPKLIALSAFNDGGPVMDAFRRVLAARRAPVLALAHAARPRLDCAVDAKTYWAEAMSGSRRRKLGQLRRRLAGRGALELQVHRGAGAVADALDRFMPLEASGWKGSIGHALARTALAFTQAAVPALAAEGGAEIWELSLDRAAVSMAIILRQGAGAFDWKIAYDERHADCSPGVLLAQDYTTAFLGDPAIAFADSCAADDTGLLGPLWTGRQAMTDLILDVRPGGSLAFTAWSTFEAAHRAARRHAKGPVDAVRARLRQLMRKRVKNAEAEQP